MSKIAVYRDWDKQRLNIFAKKIRQTEGYGHLVLPRAGQVIVIERVSFSQQVSLGTATNIANMQLTVCDSSGNAAPLMALPGAVYTGTNTGTSATVCTVSGGGMTVNAYQLRLLRYKTGVNAGKVRQITSNDATTITTPTFTTAPSNGDTFEILDQFGVVPILPMWKLRRDAAARLSDNKNHSNLEIVLGEGAGIGYIARQATFTEAVGPTDFVYVPPTEFSLHVQARYEPAGYQSSTANFQIQPTGTLP